MIVRRQGRLTEFIPSPQEKREGLLRDHTLCMLKNIDTRLRRLEQKFGLSSVEMESFATIMSRIRQEETENRRINQKLMESSGEHIERPD